MAVSKLAQELFDEYMARKKQIIEKYCPNGKGIIPSSAVAELTDRECAGNFLASFGMNALTAFDSLPPHIRDKYIEQHPETRDLLAKACAASLITN